MRTAHGADTTSKSSCVGDRIFFISMSLFSILVFAIRGNQYSRTLYGDDAELVSHAVSRKFPWGILGRYDTLGLLDPFNGYIFLLPRVFTHVGLIGDDQDFVFRIFIYSTILFSVLAVSIGRSAYNVVSPAAGYLTVVVFALMPFSNLVLLAQANATTWPLALYVIVIAALRDYPRKTIWRIVFLLVSFITTLSTLLSIVFLTILCLDIALSRFKVKRYELTLLATTATLFLIQLQTYESRDNPAVPFGTEFGRVLFGFAPQYIRKQILGDLSVIDRFVLIAYPSLMLMCWIGLAVFVWRKHHFFVIAAIRMFVSGVAITIILIIGNGWFNSHYLFIPSGLFWISSVMLASVAVRNGCKIERSLAALLAGLFLFQLSGIYYVL